MQTQSLLLLSKWILEQFSKMELNLAVSSVLIPIPSYLEREKRWYIAYVFVYMTINDIKLNPQ